MPQVGFEPKIPAFEQEKTVHASDRVATVIGKPHLHVYTYIHYIYNVTCRPIAKERADKHVSVEINSWKPTHYGTRFPGYV
jgi:hypothetical protein